MGEEESVTKQGHHTYFSRSCKQVPFKGKKVLFSKYGLNRLEMEISKKYVVSINRLHDSVTVPMLMPTPETDSDKQKSVSGHKKLGQAGT